MEADYCVNGKTKVLDLTVTPTMLGGEQVVFCIGMDITERKQAEQELRASESRFRELFDHMSSGVAVYEAKDSGNDFVFKNLNRAGEQIDQIRKKDIVGKSVQQLFPGVKKFGLFEVFQRVWKTGKPEHHPVSLYEDDRIAGWRENYVYKLPSGEIVAVYDDMTERKKAEQGLQNSQAKLQEQKLALEQKNIALREMIDQIDLERKRIEENVALNVNEVLLPVLEKLKGKNISHEYLDQLEHGLEKLTSSFSRKIKMESDKLTAREIEICHMIESGFSSKEISRLLNISCQTVEKHRKNIRKKMGISNKDVNLTAFLKKL